MWLVFEVMDVGVRRWAWCKPDPDGPGFVDVTMTDANGLEFVDLPEAFQLGTHLFTVDAKAEA